MPVARSTEKVLAQMVAVMAATVAAMEARKFPST
jgi:hypothetical protein